MLPMFFEVLTLFAVDAVFVGLCALALVPLAMYRHAAFALLKRNFVGYFSNPTGYVFLCIFVLLTSFAAFWPHEFFRTNLANLDQLNTFFPYIMLVFIPAITMSIWAEERRQGTDELLLTLPAEDFDIVIGKFLAAAAIFTASLLFSQFSNYAVLISLTLGDLDTGLLLATYFGYWLAGLAMLSIGMVASFLTSNLTVGFILGAVFNAPLAFATSADVIIRSNTLARLISHWGIASQMDDFTRGVISLSATAYFVMVIVVGIYLSMVLIGRRHWTGGRDGTSLLGHYLLRTLALVVVALGANIFFSNYDFRQDWTEGRVSSLSRDTLKLLNNLEPEHTIQVEAFISAQVPEVYVKTRYDLIAMLKEFRSKAAGKMAVTIHDNLEPFSEQAALAEERFGIVPQPVRTRSRGAIKDEEVILGAVFTSGVEKVVVPFFDYGVPVEYELIRSISTVAKSKRSRVGVVRTDAQLFGGFSFAGGRPQQIPRQAIIEELEKQYDLEQVDPNSPIEPGQHDVLLVAQPSSLNQQQLDNVTQAIRRGQPTALFEDPRPIFLSGVPGTGEPKRPMGGGMFGSPPPEPKGNIRELWNLLGLDVTGRPSPTGGFDPEIVWQRYNPYPKLQLTGIPDSWVFASLDAPGGEEAINPADKITSGLREIFFPVPGAIRPSRDSELKFTKLITTGDMAGTIRYQDFMESLGNPYMLQARQGNPKGEQVLAARIQGQLDDENQAMSDAGSRQVALQDENPTDEETTADETNEDEMTEEGQQANGDEPPSINVVYVTDIDLMISAFLRIRARPDEDPEDINWRFENVTFLLNVIDVLSGDDAFVDIRKRKPYHSTLKMVEMRTQELRAEELRQRMQFQQDFDKAVNEAEEESKKAAQKFVDAYQDLVKRQQEGEQIDPALLQEKLVASQMQQQVATRRFEIKRERLERDRDHEVERIRREIDLQVLGIQNEYKFWAVVLPPIPPLLVGLVVFVRRRLREREGIARSRWR